MSREGREWIPWEDDVLQEKAERTERLLAGIRGGDRRCVEQSLAEVGPESLRSGLERAHRKSIIGGTGTRYSTKALLDHTLEVAWRDPAWLIGRPVIDPSDAYLALYGFWEGAFREVFDVAVKNYGWLWANKTGKMPQLAGWVQGRASCPSMVAIARKRLNALGLPRHFDAEDTVATAALELVEDEDQLFRPWVLDGTPIDETWLARVFTRKVIDVTVNQLRAFYRERRALNQFGCTEPWTWTMSQSDVEEEQSPLADPRVSKGDRPPAGGGPRPCDRIH